MRHVDLHRSKINLIKLTRHSYLLLLQTSQITKLMHHLQQEIPCILHTAHCTLHSYIFVRTLDLTNRPTDKQGGWPAIHSPNLHSTTSSTSKQCTMYKVRVFFRPAHAHAHARCLTCFTCFTCFTCLPCLLLHTSCLYTCMHAKQASREGYMRTCTQSQVPSHPDLELSPAISRDVRSKFHG